MKTERKGWVVSEPFNGIPYIEPIEWSCTEANCCGGQNCGLTSKEAKEAVTEFYASEAKYLRRQSVEEFMKAYEPRDRRKWEDLYPEAFEGNPELADLMKRFVDFMVTFKRDTAQYDLLLEIEELISDFAVCTEGANEHITHTNEVLEKIAADFEPPEGTEVERLASWRKLAVERIDLAQQALARYRS